MLLFFFSGARAVSKLSRKELHFSPLNRTLESRPMWKENRPRGFCYRTFADLAPTAHPYTVWFLGIRCDYESRYENIKGNFEINDRSIRVRRGRRKGRARKKKSKTHLAKREWKRIRFDIMPFRRFRQSAVCAAAREICFIDESPQGIAIWNKNLRFFSYIHVKSKTIRSLSCVWCSFFFLRECLADMFCAKALFLFCSMYRN